MRSSNDRDRGAAPVLAVDFFSQTTLTFTLLGMATGALYALIGLGVVVAYRSSGVLNFALTAVGAIPAYLFYELRDTAGAPWVVALVVAIVLGALLGVGTQLLVISFLANASLLTKLIATLSLMAAAIALTSILWGGNSLGLPRSILPTDLVQISSGVSIAQDRLIIIALVVILAIVLEIVYRRTVFGLATSAVAESQMIASTSGWSPGLIERVNFAIAGALATLATILIAPIVGLSATTLAFLIVPALAAALVGKFSSFGLVVASAFGMGILSSELGLFRPDIAKALGVEATSLAGLPNVVPLLVIIVVVVFGGRARLERGETLARLPLPGSGRPRAELMIIGIVIAGTLLFTSSPDWTAALTLTFVGGLLSLSIVVLTGYCGQLSLAQFALAGFGAWVAGRLAMTVHLPFWLAAIAGMLGAAALGLVVAIPALRTRGVYLAVVTLGLAQMLTELIFLNGSLTGGYSGTTVDSPSIFGIDLDPIRHPERYGALTLIMLVLVGLMVANLRRGRVGRRLLAVRGNERAAASVGVGVYATKLYAFAVSSAIAGLSGIFFAFRYNNLQFDQFNVTASINAVVYTVLGGLGYVAGAIIGGLQSPGGVGAELLDTIFASSGNGVYWLAFLSGAGVLVMLRRAPDGFAALYANLIGSRLPRLRPFRSSRQDAAPLPEVRRATTLEVRDIGVRFGGVVALDSVSFSVRPGEVVGLIGPNGAGKTTMVDVITGFTNPSTGTVLLDGEVIDGWSPERRARAGLARSWQSVELFEEMTIRENLLVAADRKRLRHFATDLIRPGRPPSTALMNSLIEEFRLEDYLDARPSALPQGIARLAGIARAIVTEPAVLLLDEPAAGLDVHESAELGHVIRRIADERGIGVLVIEHDVTLVMGTCDQLVVLDFGEKIAHGPPEEVGADDNVIRAYLGETSQEDGTRAVAAVRDRGPAPADAPTVLSTKSLRAGYGQVEIVRDLTLQVRAGEVVALLGPNGAGKTTTALTLAGQLRKLGGTVELHGEPTKAALHERVRGGLGLVTERRAVLMSMTVAENLKVNQGDTDYALRLFPELEPALGRRVAMLSGGQQQMLALARALSRRPNVLIADELSLGLAPLVVGRLLDAVRTAADDGLGVLLIEQHVHRALEIADRAYLLRRGRVELEATAQELIDRLDDVQAVYLSNGSADSANPAYT